MPESNLSSFIWSVADLLRGDYKQSEYGRVRAWPVADTWRACLTIAADGRLPSGQILRG